MQGSGGLQYKNVGRSWQVANSREERQMVADRNTGRKMLAGIEADKQSWSGSGAGTMRRCVKIWDGGNLAEFGSQTGNKCVSGSHTKTDWGSEGVWAAV
jgi:hypothetical protein